MAQYDPQRSRTRHRKADDEGPAPVDALLGPVPDAAPAASEPEPERMAPDSGFVSDGAEPPLLEVERLEPETTLDVVRSLTSPGPTIWMAVSATLAAAVGLAVVVLRRRRRDRRRARAAGDATR